MKQLVICTTLMLWGLITVFAQSKKYVITEITEVQNGNVTEAQYYYENNWLQYRKAMLSKGFIASFKLMKVIPDSTNTVTLILETVYKDSMQFVLAEPLWQAIIKEINPEGPRLLNEKRPNEFRKIVVSKISEVLFTESLAVTEKKRKK